MKQLQPVLWSKGTFLTPQHLQLQDKFLEDSLNFRLQALVFSAWGFSELVLNEDLLAKGELAIIRASGIFPDGLIFEIPGPDQPPPSKALAELFDPGNRELYIYLTVPNYKPKGLNVTGLGGGGDSRYWADIASVRDHNVGTEEKTVEVQVARKNLRLLAMNENRGGSSELQIAKIEKTGDGAFRLDSRFVPPLLEAQASNFLLTLVKGLVEVLSGKSGHLSALRRQKNQSLAEFAAADTMNFWLLYTVNSSIPVLGHLLNEQGERQFQGHRCHPQELFSALTALGASLTTFSETIHPRDLPLYDHLNLGPKFIELDEKLRFLLETVVPTNIVPLQLTHQKGTIYGTAIDQDKYFANTRMFLAVASDNSDDTLIRKFPKLVKAGSAAHVEQLINSSVPGIELTYVPPDRLTIPRNINYQYFILNQSRAAWDTVTRARNFAVHVPSDFPNPKMELIILLPRASSEVLR